MSRAARVGRRAAIGHVVEFRLLPYEVTVAVEDERLVPVLAYLANRARQPRTPLSTMRYDVTGRGPYVIHEEGDHVAAVRTPDDVLFVVYQRCHARLLDHMALGSWVALHAGVVRIAGRRAVVLGDKGVGKTTLLLRLLHDGHEVEGDEVVFIRAGLAVSQPRNFHVKPSTMPLLPELAGLWASLPTTSTSDGLVIRAFDPTVAGFEWVITEDRIDASFVLHGDHDGTARCRVTTAVAGVAAAVTHALPTSAPTATIVRACSSVLGDAVAHELTVGDLADTAALVVAAMGEASVRSGDETGYSAPTRPGGDRG